ncbi:hypothetical protein [Tenacibaculum xiamenense]|uniref:hypothetical protein n=1 Tax=Tenacibaculum xiamenense TaxID=1261553 RepID=UPI0038B591BC
MTTNQSDCITPKELNLEKYKAYTNHVLKYSREDKEYVKRNIDLSFINGSLLRISFNNQIPQH